MPKSLGGQLVALLFLALIGAQAITLLVLAGERNEAIWQINRAGLLERTASVMRILERVPPDLRGEIAEAAGSRRIRFWVSPASVVPEDGEAGRGPLALQFDRMLGEPLRARPRIAFVDRGGEGNSFTLLPPRPHGMAELRAWRQRIAEEQRDIVVSVALPDAMWLNAQTRTRAEPVALPWPTLVSTAATAVAILLVAVFIARRVTRPLGRLAANADAFGRGAPVQSLPEAGPDEIRKLTAAFNRMQERIRSFIGDRTRLLAAIGHDLRTPITSLRLRAELVEDEETRAKMLATLDEMQHITEATLELGRQEARPEDLRVVDLAALVESLADDLSDLGMDVRFAERGRLPYPCRPNALRRALRNIVENAVRYGRRARIALAETPSGPLVTIEDDGPGIPEERIADAFEPFVRMEQSRSRETGGAGLGLAIARSIVRGHGGDVVLANRPEGGLRAEVRLPRDAHA
ncbi:HAMP domain-containing protein [Rhizobiales bacterium L72]|uniref:histidine kinase n=1 Tax=Propylenella binzhouense TaxID=2555902 RepID=A0A964WVG1_9HYPH|nr:ATP-binding protein [Propylenella binzhouense]MYZ50197.1 HAMP domain-containing protein [Propylenella binzhouense]